MSMVLQLGVFISSFDPEKAGKAARAVARKVNGRIGYYQSRIPLSTTLLTPRQGKRTDPSKANHVIVTAEGEKILELYGTRARASGRLYRNDPALVRILADHDVYTFESFKKRHPGVRDFMLFAGTALIILGLHNAVVS